MRFVGCDATASYLGPFCDAESSLRVRNRVYRPNRGVLRTLIPEGAGIGWGGHFINRRIHDSEHRPGH